LDSRIGVGKMRGVKLMSTLPSAEVDTPAERGGGMYRTLSLSFSTS